MLSTYRDVFSFAAKSTVRTGSWNSGLVSRQLGIPRMCGNSCPKHNMLTFPCITLENLLQQVFRGTYPDVRSQMLDVSLLSGL